MPALEVCHKAKALSAYRIKNDEVIFTSLESLDLLDIGSSHGICELLLRLSVSCKYALYCPSYPVRITIESKAAPKSEGVNSDIPSNVLFDAAAL
ncbi:hypothetical protein N7524_011057 [Penicillium chrysogenum]|nr:hypothetical protein N7524_011057 [Penicillium chrysogenum]